MKTRNSLRTAKWLRKPSLQTINYPDLLSPTRNSPAQRSNHIRFFYKEKRHHETIPSNYSHHPFLSFRNLYRNSLNQTRYIIMKTTNKCRVQPYNHLYRITLGMKHASKLSTYIITSIARWVESASISEANRQLIMLD